MCDWGSQGGCDSLYADSSPVLFQLENLKAKIWQCSLRSGLSKWINHLDQLVVPSLRSPSDDTSFV